MCTLIVARDIDIRSEANDHVDVMVGANRDEMLDRPADPPALIEHNGVRVLAPRDRRAGGTWLGLNEHGLFAGLTNRYGGGHDPDRNSRGELVFKALAAQSASSAADCIQNLDGALYNGFHLICADADAMHLVWGGPEPIVASPVGSTFAVITERSLGAARDARKRRAKQLIREAMVAGEFGPNGLREMLSRTDEGSFEDFCICLDGVNYGTRSSTILEIGDTPRGWHAEGPPCNAAYKQISPMMEKLLDTHQ